MEYVGIFENENGYVYVMITEENEYVYGEITNCGFYQTSGYYDSLEDCYEGFMVENI